MEGGESGVLETESDEGYVNRSFVNGKTTVAGPFEFVSSSAYPTE